jgi:NADH-quinone oxidoreductase subunit J
LDQALVYISYVVAALASAAVYAALPRMERAPRRVFFISIVPLAIGALLLLFGRLMDGSGRQVSFVILALLALGGALRVVTHPQPVYSALYFVMVVLSTAAMMVLAGAEFLGAALVIVYAGAILVTYVFVIMLAQQSGLGASRIAGAQDYDRRAREPLAAVIAGFVLIATIAGVIVGRGGESGGGVVVNQTEGNTLAIGALLLHDFAVSVELAGVLLMVAMIGAIALARRRFPRSEESPAYAPGEVGKHVKPF